MNFSISISVANDPGPKLSKFVIGIQQSLREVSKAKFCNDQIRLTDEYNDNKKII